MTWWAWMILGAVFLSIELFAVEAQFYLVFLGVAAAMVGLLGLFGIVLPEWGQWLAFTTLSLAFFFSFRPMIYSKIRSGGESYPESMSGESVKIDENLSPGTQSRIQYRGTEWTVRNVGDEMIAGGSRVEIVKVEGLTLHVSAN
jgi:membrane protein implicated in regulation of membrane protease activity